ncbi:MAG: hypothetical protein ACI8Y4_004730 [Candidatus Poriferisodalaceae bacterium]|jgi:hypothetical protein
MMRCVDRRGSEVAEERTIRRAGLLALDPLDCLVGEVFGEVVVVSPDVGLDRRRLVVAGGFPVRCFGADRPVVAVEAHAFWPTVERASWSLLPRRDEMPLAESSGGVAVLAEDLSDGGCFTWDRRVVAGEAVSDLGDAAHVNRVMIAAGQQRGSGR